MCRYGVFAASKLKMQCVNMGILKAVLQTSLTFIYQQ